MENSVLQNVHLSTYISGSVTPATISASANAAKAATAGGGREGTGGAGAGFRAQRNWRSVAAIEQRTAAVKTYAPGSGVVSERRPRSSAQTRRPTTKTSSIDHFP